MKPSHYDPARYAAPAKSSRHRGSGWWHRALRELADELEGEGGEAVVEWDPLRKIPLMKNDLRQTVGKPPGAWICLVVVEDLPANIQTLRTFAACRLRRQAQVLETKKEHWSEGDHERKNISFSAQVLSKANSALL